MCPKLLGISIFAVGSPTVVVRCMGLVSGFVTDFTRQNLGCCPLACFEPSRACSEPTQPKIKSFQNNRWTSNVDKDADKMGLKLVLCGFFVSIWLILHGFTIMYNMVNKMYFGAPDKVGQLISGLVGDIFTGINPFMLLLFNSKVRLEFMKLFRCTVSL